MITVATSEQILREKLGYNYLEYANGNCRNHGARGNAFEMCVKLALKNKRFKKVARAGRFDTTKKSIYGDIIHIECKTGSGELWHIDRDGTAQENNFFKSDFVVYCHSFKPLMSLDEQEVFVIPSDVFLRAMEQNKLTRTKMTTYMRNAELPAELKYEDVYSLNVSDASRKNKLFKILEDMIVNGEAVYLYEFLSDYFNID